MNKIKEIKSSHLLVASLSSGILLGLSYWPWSPIFSAFIAIIPLLWVGYRAALWPMMATVFGASLIAVGLADWEIFTRHGLTGGLLLWVIQAIILSLPWLSFHLIHHRHNPKLGLWALLGSWLTLEWASGQLLGWWQGFQLGYAFMSWPVLVQWYAILGVSGGTLWALAVNSQIYRILFPNHADDKRAGLINLVIFIIFPLSYSFFSYYNGEEEQPKSIHLVEADCNADASNLSSQILLVSFDESFAARYPQKSILYAEGQQFLSWQYDKAADSLHQAILLESNKKTPIYARNLKVSGIAGFSSINSHLLKWDKLPLGLLNSYSLMHADLVRLYKAQGVTLFLAFAEADAKNLGPLGKKRLQLLAQTRALENRTAMIVIQPKQQSFMLLPSGQRESLIWKDSAAKVALRASRESFYSNYGDLIGRVSIFFTIWLLLATIVKPYRKK